MPEIRVGNKAYLPLPKLRIVRIRETSVGAGAHTLEAKPPAGVAWILISGSVAHFAGAAKTVQVYLKTDEDDPAYAYGSPMGGTGISVNSGAYMNIFAYLSRSAFSATENITMLGEPRGFPVILTDKSWLLAYFGALGDAVAMQFLLMVYQISEEILARMWGFKEARL
jgi:hypothetical protein